MREVLAPGAWRDPETFSQVLPKHKWNILTEFPWYILVRGQIWNLKFAELQSGDFAIWLEKDESFKETKH